jgi:hypothetical protein
MKIKNLAMGVGLALFIAPLLSAQERSAGGSQQYQASWSSLKTMIDQTNGTLSAMQIDVSDLKGKMTDVTACGNNMKLYAPQLSPNTTHKCVDVLKDLPQDPLIKKILSCGTRKMFTDKDGNCVSIAASKTPTLQCTAAPSHWEGTHNGMVEPHLVFTCPANTELLSNSCCSIVNK